ncbi:MAG: hypothetical protein R3231_08105, partial [bacterium]|nr:hypothetical protein [bacterium]
MKMARHLFIGFCARVVLAGWASSAAAFINYGATGQNCKACHLIFSGGTGNATHNVHAAAVGNICGVCHGGFPPALENCVQCHRQAGLVAHHENANTGAGCGGCHPGLTPLPENVVPIGYTTVATIPLDSCDGSEERFDSFTVSLDNDGDLLYDGDDPDCAVAVCGNGTIEAGEDCDDGNTLDGDCCSANCLFETNGSPCPDGVFCNGDETCDGAGACLAGPIPPCSDGVDCTVDTCDPTTDDCINTPNDNNCPDDGAFCTGDEFCDAVVDCTSTGDPCDVGTTCNEDTDTCDAAQDCGNGILDTGEECDDGNTMDGDCCSANCTFETAGSSCDDGLFCNGEDTCDGAGTCDLGSAVDCDDGVLCTTDSCDEAAEACVNSPDDAACDDGTFCNGVETCDAVNDCQAGTPPDCSDGV